LATEPSSAVELAEQASRRRIRARFGDSFARHMFVTEVINAQRCDTFRQSSSDCSRDLLGASDDSYSFFGRAC
jgi:hypothetical protein